MFDRHYAVWPENMPRHLSLPQTSLLSMWGAHTDYRILISFGIKG